MVCIFLSQISQLKFMYVIFLRIVGRSAVTNMSPIGRQLQMTV